MDVCTYRNKLTVTSYNRKRRRGKTGSAKTTPVFPRLDRLRVFFSERPVTSRGRRPRRSKTPRVVIATQTNAQNRASKTRPVAATEEQNNGRLRSRREGGMLHTLHACGRVINRPRVASQFGKIFRPLCLFFGGRENGILRRLVFPAHRRADGEYQNPRRRVTCGGRPMVSRWRPAAGITSGDIRVCRPPFRQLSEIKSEASLGAPVKWRGGGGGEATAGGNIPGSPPELDAFQTALQKGRRRKKKPKKKAAISSPSTRGST